MCDYEPTAHQFNRLNYFVNSGIFRAIYEYHKSCYCPVIVIAAFFRNINEIIELPNLIISSCGTAGGTLIFRETGRREAVWP